MSACDNCKDGASKLAYECICEVNDMLQNLSTVDDEDNDVSICANCGKEGSSNEINNTCNKCKQVKYCNAACKKKHRHKHKKECEEHLRLTAEHAAKLHDERLFIQPPSQKEDCPICFLRMPNLNTGWKYNPCCGKVICSGCDYAPVYDNQGNEVFQKSCPYCRTPASKSQREAVQRMSKRVEAGDPIAIRNTGNYYRDGRNGYPQDYSKALELYHRAAKLGHAEAYTAFGIAYSFGKGVDVDKKKAKHYFELAAIGGDTNARHNLGNIEALEHNNQDRALKHYMIAVRGGDSESLKVINLLYSLGRASKEDYTKALQSYQEYLAEIKSKQRDKAAAEDEENRYY